MNWKLIISVLAVIGIGIVAGMYLPRSQNGTTSTSTTASERPLKTYYDERYGIAFNFPDNYDVQEHDSTGAGAKHHTIVVGDKGALAGAPANSEGPPVITIDIFPNPGNPGAEKWIKATNESNYKLSPDGVLTATKVAGYDAIAYVWDGLYRSTTIVFPHKSQMYMLSVGYNSPTDQIRQDFPKVVASIQFDP